MLATPVAYRRKQWLDMGLLQVAMLPYLTAGGWLLAGCPAGLYWLVPALLLSLCKATLDAWVLLIEIHR